MDMCRYLLGMAIEVVIAFIIWVLILALAGSFLSLWRSREAKDGSPTVVTVQEGPDAQDEDVLSSRTTRCPSSTPTRC